jgi:outer membrane protein assembly factor BamB
MKKRFVLTASPNGLLLSLTLCALLSLAAGRASAEATEEARQIASAANFHGGLVIHIGCGDGRLTAALRLGENCTVQGFDTDPSRVEAARTAIRQRGGYGPISVIRWNGEKLPHVDNLATLVVCEDLDAARRAEALRVVRPFGALVSKRNGKWQATFKPQMRRTDQWGQHFKGADNNAVAQDTVVGPPRRFQWRNTPEWQRSHLAMPSISSIISMNGRLFTVEDLASAEHPALPGKHALVARDAYNGVRLWQLMFPNWHPICIGVKHMPVQIQRRLAASGDKVYCTPGYAEPITLFDAATGSVIKKFEKTAGTVEFVLDRDMIFTVTGEKLHIEPTLEKPKQGVLKESAFPAVAYGSVSLSRKKMELVAVDVNSGQERWRLGSDDVAGYYSASLCAIGNRVVFATYSELVCLDRSTGKTHWRVPVQNALRGSNSMSVTLSDRAVYLTDRRYVRSFRLSTGEEMWKAQVGLNHYKAADLFLTGGLVWVKTSGGTLGVSGYDPETGKLVKQIERTVRGHGRCYRNRITSRYCIISESGGSDFLDFETGT